MMTPDDTSPTARLCGSDHAHIRLACSKCESFFCLYCEPGVGHPPSYRCRKCRDSEAPATCTCGATRVACWSCDKLHCPNCDRVCGETPYQCTFCGKEDSGLADKQTTHDIGAVLEIAWQENERLLAALKTCVSAITGLLDSSAPSDSSVSDWSNLRGARHIARVAIDKAEGQPTATGSDEKSGASTKVSSPPSEPMVVDVLVEFQDKLAQVIVDLRWQGPPTETPTQEPE